MEKLILRTMGDYFIGRPVSMAAKSGSIIIPDSVKSEEYVVFAVVGIDDKTSGSFGIKVGDHVVCSPRGMMTAPIELSIDDDGSVVTGYDTDRFKLVRASNVVAVYSREVPTEEREVKLVNG